MKTIILGLITLSVLMFALLGCNKVGISKRDQTDIEKFLNSNYTLAEIDTISMKQCITDSIVLNYTNKHGKLVKSAGEEYLIDVDSPEKIQEQKLLFPFNLPKENWIEGLDIYFNGSVEKNPARSVVNDSSILISIDGQQRIFLTELWIKK